MKKSIIWEFDRVIPVLLFVLIHSEKSAFKVDNLSLLVGTWKNTIFQGFYINVFEIVWSVKFNLTVLLYLPFLQCRLSGQVISVAQVWSNEITIWKNGALNILLFVNIKETKIKEFKLE